MPKDCVHFGKWEHRDVHNLYGKEFVSVFLWLSLGVYVCVYRTAPKLSGTAPQTKKKGPLRLGQTMEKLNLSNACATLMVEIRTVSKNKMVAEAGQT
jgi:hypothetical protein